MTAATTQLDAFADSPERELSKAPGECRYVAVCGREAPGDNRICDVCLALVRHNDVADGLDVGDRSMLAHVERLYRHYGWDFGGEV